jgi:hypothetical protein
MEQIKLGSKIRCRVTGLEGIATSRVEYINGCIQYALTPKAEGNKYPDAIYMDEKQIEVIGDGITVPAKRTGGPQMGAPKN